MRYGASVEQQRRDRDQRVEPAARLVDRLADVVGGERRAEQLLVLERRVALGERHRARVEPDVDHLGHAAHLGAALRARPRVLVDERPVRVGQLAAGALLHVRQRAEALGVAVLAAPDRQRRAPVALARDRPVDVVLQPLAEAAVLDVLRVPVDRLVGGEQAVAQRRRADVPGRLGVVDQRRAAAPAVRVGVEERLGAQQPPARAQVLDEVGIGVLDPAAGVRADALVVGAVEPHRVDDLETLLGAEPEVVLAERDRGVHDAGAVVGADEVGRQHGVALLPVRLGRDERERRLVAGADQLAAGEAVDDLDPLADHLLGARLGQHLAARRAHVGQLRVDGERGVGRERPGRRRPGEQLVALAQRAGRPRDREAHVDGRVLDVLVALRDLVRGERRAAARAVGDDLVALVEQVAVPHRLERPPDRLDVARVERVVRVVHVDPVADPLGQRAPVGQVLEHRLAALAVELGDPVALDVVLGLEAELLLDGDLDRQPVGVPAGLALDVVPGHRLVAREDVLEDARQDVVRARVAVRRRRALVEDERRRPLAVAQGGAEDVALAPAREHLLLQRGEGDGRRERLVDGAHCGAGILGLRHGTGPDRGRRAARRRVRGARPGRVRDARGGPRRGRRPARARADARGRGDRARRRRPAPAGARRLGPRAGRRAGDAARCGVARARERVQGRPPVRQRRAAVRVRRRRGARALRGLPRAGDVRGLRDAGRRARCATRRSSASTTASYPRGRSPVKPDRGEAGDEAPGRGRMSGMVVRTPSG